VGDGGPASFRDPENTNPTKSEGYTKITYTNNNLNDINSHNSPPKRELHKNGASIYY
jgi:hypothetical protein